MKTTFRRTRPRTGYSKMNRKGQALVHIIFSDMTQGEAMALCHALKNYSSSPVCEDLRVSLQYTIQDAGKTDQDQELFECIKK